MTAEVIAHACEPFFTTRGRAGHDGLGLTVVHSMLRQVGGTLALGSDGRGSTVTVYFPVAPMLPVLPRPASELPTSRAETPVDRHTSDAPSSPSRMADASACAL